MNGDCSHYKKELNAAGHSDSDPTFESSSSDSSAVNSDEYLPIDTEDRKEILYFVSPKFSGYFEDVTRSDAPESLRSHISLMIHGKATYFDHPEVNFISGMVLENSRSVKKERKTKIRRKSSEKETDLFRYISLWQYGQVKI